MAAFSPSVPLVTNLRPVVEFTAAHRTGAMDFSLVQISSEFIVPVAALVLDDSFLSVDMGGSLLPAKFRSSIFHDSSPKCFMSIIYHLFNKYQLF